MRCPHCKKTIIDDEWSAKNAGDISWFATTFFTPISDRTALLIFKSLPHIQTASQLSSLFTYIKHIPESHLHTILSHYNSSSNATLRGRAHSIKYLATYIVNKNAEIVARKQAMLPLPKAIRDEEQRNNKAE